MSRSQFTGALASQELRAGDAIVLMAGDGTVRVPYAAQLFAQGLAPIVVVLSADARHEYGSMTSGELTPLLLEAGVPQEAIYAQEVAYNTRDEAVHTVALARERRWRSLIFITSPHHQYRAFLTFLKAMRDAKLELILTVAVVPVDDVAKGRYMDLVPQEYERIEKYAAQGDVASYEEGLDYLRWREKQ